MYDAWWGLKENPFSLSPDPAFFYRSQQHEEAFANLIYGIESRKGFIALTGEVGTGKTTVLECLRDYLRSRDIGYITISNSRLSVPEFFELIRQPQFGHREDFRFQTCANRLAIGFAARVICPRNDVLQQIRDFAE